MNSRCPCCPESPLLIAVSYDPAHFRCNICRGESFSFNALSGMVGEYFIQRNVQLLEYKFHAPGFPCARCGDRMLITRPCQSYLRQERYGALKPALPHWKGWSESLEIQSCHSCFSFWIEHEQLKRIPDYRGTDEDKYEDHGEPTIDVELASLAMQIPSIQNLREINSTAVVVWSVSAICIVITLMKHSLSPDWFSFVPTEPFKHHGFNNFSALFMHADSEHVAINLLFLITFGRHLEKRMRTEQFLFLFFFCGTTGHLASHLMYLDPNVSCVGASGAISGVMVYFACVFPKAIINLPIMSMFGLTVRPTFAAPIFTLIWFGLEFLYSSVSNDGIGHYAHLGGALGGLIFWIMFEREVPMPVPAKQVSRSASSIK